VIPLRSPVAQGKLINHCNECGETNLLRDNDTGELICRSCGIVLSSIQLDTRPEWRAFDQMEREKRPRVGAPVNWTIHDKGLSTNIGWKNIDASGKKLNPEMRAKIYRLRKWHRRNKYSNNKQRNLSKALIEMTKIKSKLNLPKNVSETTSIIYRKALNNNLIRGRTSEYSCSKYLYGLQTMWSNKKPKRNSRFC
jgi:transcription initiation factor TFIIB